MPLPSILSLLQDVSLCCSVPNISEHNNFVHQSAGIIDIYCSIQCNNELPIVVVVRPLSASWGVPKSDEFFLCAEDPLEIGTEIHPGLQILNNDIVYSNFSIDSSVLALLSLTVVKFIQ